MKIEIEYCEVWNYLPEADRVSAELSHLEGVDVILVAGKGGVFEVRSGGVVIWKKVSSGVFPEAGEVLKLLVEGWFFWEKGAFGAVDTF